MPVRKFIHCSLFSKTVQPDLDLGVDVSGFSVMWFESRNVVVNAAKEKSYN